jgi:hypothetical protein
VAVSSLGEKLGRLARRSKPPADGEPSAEARASDRLPFLRSTSPFWIYAGLVLIGVGFTAIGITWGKVAAELQVALQLPYLVSGGLTGLSLIIIGATVINIAVKRRDAAKRTRQLEQLAEILRNLRDVDRDEREP